MTNLEFFKRRLQKPAWLLLALVFALVTIIYGGSLLEDKLTQRFMQEKSRLDGLMNQVIFLEEQYHLFQQYGAAYQEMTQKGLTKEQDRVLWTDVFLQQKSRRWLNPITIQFESQKKLEQNEFHNLKLSRPIFYKTEINLTVGAQTDLDLFATLEDINQLISPFFLLKSCEIERISTNTLEIDFNAQNSNFNVACSLTFFNSKPSKFKGIQDSNDYELMDEMGEMGMQEMEME